MYQNQIKKFRKEKQITLQQMAKICGISTGYLCHLEKGSRKNPSTKVMENIAEALNKTVAEIFFTK